MEKRLKYTCSYDHAGNLVKTIPPAGVDAKHSDAIFLQQVAAARLNVKNGQSEALNKKVPGHTLATDYRYNTLNQVVVQKTPDAGKTKFFYDRLGRMTASQNAQQLLDKKYSYTLYDELGRITEVGQKPNVTDPNSKDPKALQVWLAQGGLNKEQITRTKYDLSYNNGDDILKGFLEQKNLRNRVSFSMVFDKEPDPNILGTHYSATYFSYDPHGNADSILQDFNFGEMKATGNRFKKMVYDYDLISGKVNKVAYQQKWEDQFFHKYLYDAENRLTDVFVSRDSKNWYKDARYSYYKHGPKAKEIIGQNQVMGNDYAYTLQEWLKGVNSTNMEPPLNKLNLGDIGADGYPNGNIINQVARDAYGFALHYYSTANAKDYKPINNTVQPFANAAAAGFGFVSLYNGNIAGVSMNIPILGDALLSTYKYDQLNRLTKVNTYKGLNPQTNNWNVVAIDDHREELTYDANGNIQTYKRNGFGNNLNLNNYSYTYQDGTNKLTSLKNSVDNKISAYGYDAIGNVIKDEKQNVLNNTWNLYGKLQKVEKKDGKIITYSYDAGGNRISKTVGDTTEIYVRDAAGNVMLTYQKNPLINSGHVSTKEFYKYGSNLLGIKKKAIDMQVIAPKTEIQTFVRGEDEYYLYDHRGNVVGSVSDKKIQVDANADGLVDYYIADVRTATHYSSYGAATKSFNGDSLLFGANSQRLSREISPSAQTAEFWEADMDIGRRWNIEPLIKKYPSLSGYVALNDNPINVIDPDGKEIIFIVRNTDGSMKEQLKYSKGNFWHLDGTRYNPGKESLSPTLFKVLTAYRQILKSNDKVLQGQLNTLETSKEKHYMQQVPDGQGSSVQRYNSTVVPAGQPSGSNAGFDFSNKASKEFESSEDIPNTPFTIVVHEMRHQYDHQIGNTEDNADFPSATDPAEIRAVNNENRARKIEKIKERKTYGGDKVDPKKLKNPPNNIQPKKSD